MGKKKGLAILAGAGPGDPGLITSRAREALEQAEVVIFDHLANPELLRFAPENCEKIDAGKKSGEHKLTQEEINKLLVEKTSAGKRVVRLKGGDPFLFGRGGEEAEALAAAGLRFEIVPGVTSAIAAPACAGIPVTDRRHNAQVTIFTGHEDFEKEQSQLDLAHLARTPGTWVMLMGRRRLDEICARLIAAGADEKLPVALIEWGTLPRQRVVTGTLGNIARRADDGGFKAPLLAVFGDVVELREKIAWLEKRPLHGTRIAVTRTRRQASEMVRRLRELGADAFEMPLIRIEAPPDQKQFAELVQDAHLYDWLVFTSPNGVNAFFAMFDKLYSDAREIGGVRIAAIGPGTATRVRKYRMAVDLQPEKFIAEALVEAFKKETTVENQRMLLVRAAQARDVLADSLAAMGAIVDIAAAYQTVPEKDDPAGGIARLKAEGADVITFTSSSTVENFLSLGLQWPDGAKSASIGPITSATLRSHDLPVDIEARQHDIPGLVKAIRAEMES